MSKKVGCDFDHWSGVVLVISGRAHGRFALIWINARRRRQCRV